MDGLSKNKQKKQLRNPHKTFDPSLKRKCQVCSWGQVGAYSTARTFTSPSSSTLLGTETQAPSVALSAQSQGQMPRVLGSLTRSDLRSDHQEPCTGPWSLPEL